MRRDARTETSESLYKEDSFNTEAAHINTWFVLLSTKSKPAVQRSLRMRNANSLSTAIINEFSYKILIFCCIYLLIYIKLVCSVDDCSVIPNRKKQTLISTNWISLQTSSFAIEPLNLDDVSVICFSTIAKIWRVLSPCAS